MVARLFSCSDHQIPSPCEQWVEGWGRAPTARASDSAGWSDRRAEGAWSLMALGVKDGQRGVQRSLSATNTLISQYFNESSQGAGSEDVLEASVV